MFLDRLDAGNFMLEPIARVLTFLLSTKHSLRHIFNMKIDILISSRIHNDIVYVKKRSF